MKRRGVAAVVVAIDRVGTFPAERFGLSIKKTMLLIWRGLGGHGQVAELEEVLQFVGGRGTVSRSKVVRHGTPPSQSPRPTSH
jgi:hypothetical protein